MRTLVLLSCLLVAACIAPDGDEPNPIFIGAPLPPGGIAPQASPDAGAPDSGAPDATPRHPCEPVAEAWCKMQQQCEPDGDGDLETCRDATLDACCEATFGCQLRPAAEKRDACIEDIQRQYCPGELAWPQACEWASRGPWDNLPHD